MYKIAVIGDKDSVMGFLALGLDIYQTDSDDKTAELIGRLAKENYAVIYITEQAAKGVMDIIDGYSEVRLPAIILIPGIGGSLGMGMAGVRSSVERAVGADILFKDK